MKLHKEGYSIIFSTAVFALGVVFTFKLLGSSEFVQYIVAGVMVVFWLLVIQFFRVPSREINNIKGQITSPSDGKIVVIEKVHEPEYFKDERIQVSIFMSPLNVHVQWTPMAGLIRYAVYHAGKYLVAWHPKSSKENERTTIVVESPKGEVLFRQIAGAVARRIKHYVQPGDMVESGQEVGFIKFGSRIDVFLPLDAEVHVELDAVVKGRETLLATLKG